MPKYKHKFYITPKYLIVRDACPKCHEHFEKKRVKILWHDVLECTACSHRFQQRGHRTGDQVHADQAEDGYRGAARKITPPPFHQETAAMFLQFCGHQDGPRRLLELCLVPLQWFQRRSREIRITGVMTNAILKTNSPIWIH